MSGIPPSPTTRHSVDENTWPEPLLDHDRGPHGRRNRRGQSLDGRVEIQCADDLHRQIDETGETGA